MSTTIAHWKVYCIEEDTYVHTYSVDEPTICPNDHNDRTIDPSKTRLLEYISEEKVIIEEPDLGKFTVLTEVLDIPSGTPGDVSTHELIYPMDLDIWTTTIYCLSENVGDVLNIIPNPETEVGTLTSDIQASPPTNTLDITSSTFSNHTVSKGIYVILDDGGNKEHLGRITAFDKVNFTITVENAPSFDFNTGTIVKFNCYMVENFRFLIADSTYVIGDKGLKAKSLPAGVPIQFIYTNNDGSAKKLYGTTELYYE